MDFHDQDKQIQKKIDWISSQIRETKIQLKREYKELEDALKEQEKLRKITAPKMIQWSEMCLCPTPLKHERETVYNHFLNSLETKTIDDYVEFDGDSFFDFLERQFKK